MAEVLTMPNIQRPDSVNPEMITLARESRGWTQSDLAERLRISQAKLSKLEAGAASIDDGEMDSLALALDYPRDFFCLSERIYGPSISEFFHRKRAAAAIKILDKIHAQVNIRRIHVNRLLRSVEIDPQIPYIDPDEHSGNIEDIAGMVRAQWNIKRGPIDDVVSIIEDAGGVVIRMRFDTNKVDAISLWIPGNLPLFVVNDSLPADRERWTLCHELGHLIMHKIARPDMEAEANRFAGAFLMPASEIRQHLRGMTLRDLAARKSYWKTSMAALIVRAADLGAVDAGQAKYLWAQLSGRGYRTREPAELDFPKETPTLMQELIDKHIDDLGYDLSQLAKLICWNEHEVLANYSIKGISPQRNKLRVVRSPNTNG